MLEQFRSVTLKKFENAPIKRYAERKSNASSLVKKKKTLTTFQKKECQNTECQEDFRLFMQNGIIKYLIKDGLIRNINKLTRNNSLVIKLRWLRALGVLPRKVNNLEPSTSSGIIALFRQNT